jgi:hypothetical protein
MGDNPAKGVWSDGHLTANRRRTGAVVFLALFPIASAAQSRRPHRLLAILLGARLLTARRCSPEHFIFAIKGPRVSPATALRDFRFRTGERWGRI